jgi:hypothetical protein
LCHPAPHKPARSGHSLRRLGRYHAAIEALSGRGLLPPLRRKSGVRQGQHLGLIITGWGADWPDGFGFLSQIVDSRVIRDAGNTNLGIVDPSIDAMLDQALRTTEAAAREKLWVDIDRKVDGECLRPTRGLGEGTALPPVDPDERLHHQRLPDVRLRGPGHHQALN